MNLRINRTALVAVCGAVLALAAGYVLVILSSTIPAAPPVLIGGATIVLATFLSPRLGFYLLVFSSTLGRLELAVGDVYLRPDQFALMPVFAGVVLRLLVSPTVSVRFGRRARTSAASIAVFLGFGLYIAVNALSSSWFSPQPAESYKIVIWFLLSFLAFGVVYLMVGRYVGLKEAFFALLAAGFLSAAVGLFLFLIHILTGSTFGIQQDPDARIYGTFFEANVFGSFQAFSAIAGIVTLQLGRLRGKAFTWIAIGTALSMIALALSLTRAAWLGFLAGLLVLAFFQLRRGRILSLLWRLGALALAALLALVPLGLFESFTDRLGSIADVSGGTFAFRVIRFQTALHEWPASPILGLGTNSFGQRHLDPTQNYAPDYLPNLFIATLYDTGLVGLLILLALFGIIMGVLIRVVVRGDKEKSAIALALLCGVVGLLISYQATSAFWFSYNWITIAIALKLNQVSRGLGWTPEATPARTRESGERRVSLEDRNRRARNRLQAWW